jgi:DNA segregation ATPase FtsK/SpoIIIE, S-DNA-T family
VKRVHRVLRVVSGPLEGDEFLIDERLLIGRSGDLGVQLIGPSVSRRHAEVRVESDGSAVVCDLGSRNGTFVRGERIESRVLASGDTFEIGKSSFSYEERSGDPATDDPKLNLLSGPALDVTETQDRTPLITRALRPTSAPEARDDGGECRDPLHDLARAKRWRFCPVCGEPPHDRDTGEHEIPQRE